MRLIAQRCIYGVDKNPLAVEMAKLSLWLLTMAKDKPFEFLDHSIRSGDSLVGLHSIDQLRHFSLKPDAEDAVLFRGPLDEAVDEAIELRLRLEDLPANTVEDVQRQEQLLTEANEKIARLRCAADLLVAAEYWGENAKDKMERVRHAAVVSGNYVEHGPTKEFQEAARKAWENRGPVTVDREASKDSASNGSRPPDHASRTTLQPFHWPLEFPEVTVKRGGFDAFVGNPPFLGGRRISTLCGSDYLGYLTGCEWRHAHGNADLVTYFFLRATRLLRRCSTFGLISTNTIAQGDTADTGLRWMFENEGVQIIWTRPNYRWPGAAAVIVAIVIGFKGCWQGAFSIDDVLVKSISPTLTSVDTSSKPFVLAAHRGRSAEGSKLYGKSFVLDSDTAGLLRASEPNASDVVRPFVTGQDVNESASHSASRWCIDFRNYGLETVAKNWPRTFDYARTHILPERQSSSDSTARRLWWQHQRTRAELYDNLQTMDRVLARARVTSAWGFVFLPTNQVFADKITLFLFEGFDAFAVLQCSFHEQWAWHWGTTMKTDLNYSHTDCFQTFPFPRSTTSLETVGEQYYFTRTLSIVPRMGLMKAYHSFHDPNETSADIQKLRNLHVEMDQAVAAAYGWTDLELGHGFHDGKQGLRFTISEPARREVLQRLLKLNHERHAEEVRHGLHGKKGAAGRGTSGGKKATGGSKGATKKPDATGSKKGPSLFGEDSDE